MGTRERCRHQKYGVDPVRPESVSGRSVTLRRPPETANADDRRQDSDEYRTDGEKCSRTTGDASDASPHGEQCRSCQEQSVARRDSIGSLKHRQADDQQQRRRLVGEQIQPEDSENRHE